MGNGIEIVEGAAIEPVTLGEIKRHLRIDHREDDSELETVWIPTAREIVERRLSVKLVAQTVKVTLDEFPSGHIDMPVGPLRSVTNIKYFDADDAEQTLPSGNYVLDKGRSPARISLVIGESWPATSARLAAVSITAIVGTGTTVLSVWPILRAAIVLQVRHLYEGGEGLNKTADALIDLVWDGSRHGPNTEA